MQQFENWEGSKQILIILAHPDDPEFFMGGTISRWVKQGHRVQYCLLTKGDKGFNDPAADEVLIKSIRMSEQHHAARKLGVESVEFLDYPDGYLEVDLNLRRLVVEKIRQYRPDILVTCDPLHVFVNQYYINHPDHRAAGQIVIDAVFPAAGNPFFFPKLLEEGLQPHTVEELWMSLTADPDITLDVSEHWQSRLEALKEHASQIGDADQFEVRMRERITMDDSGKIIYEEKFKRVFFRR